jgi:hypothetical protein
VTAVAEPLAGLQPELVRVDTWGMRPRTFTTRFRSPGRPQAPDAVTAQPARGAQPADRILDGVYDPELHDGPGDGEPQAGGSPAGWRRVFRLRG